MVEISNDGWMSIKQGEEMRRHMSKVRSYYWLTAMVVMTSIAYTSRSLYADTFEVTLDGISYWHESQQNMNIDLEIQPGDTVRWIWVGGFHNVVSGFPETKDTGDLFFSGPPTDVHGTIFEFTFLEPGKYGYHCHPHEEFGMISYVTVVFIPLCPWDLDSSGSVGTSDLLALLAQWGTSGPADFDDNGIVGTSDLLILLTNWGPCP